MHIHSIAEHSNIRSIVWKDKKNKIWIYSQATISGLARLHINSKFIRNYLQYLFNIDTSNKVTIVWVIRIDTLRATKDQAPWVKMRRPPVVTDCCKIEINEHWNHGTFYQYFLNIDAWDKKTFVWVIGIDTLRATKEVAPWARMCRPPVSWKRLLLMENTIGLFSWNKTFK